MSSQGEYYDVQKFGDEWVAMYDPEQQLMGKSFKTEAEARAYVEADMNSTDTDQASEADKAVMIGFLYGIQSDFLPDDEVRHRMAGFRHTQGYKDAIELIRTEKLKLLAEVREQVVGRDDSDLNTVFRGRKYDVRVRNNLRSEQRTALTKLESEL